jgi:hypothetical protein
MFDMALIEMLRNYSGESYLSLVETTENEKAIDYKHVKEHMAFTTSKNEQLLFEKLGLSVPIEAQAAFFSVLTSGAENP